MVCDRCILVVDSELRKLGLNPISVTLGEVVLEKDINEEEKQQIANTLLPIGFELIDNKKNKYVEQVKTLIIELVHQKGDSILKINLSDYLSEHIHHDYNYISNIFSEVEGTTIERYYITQKIEKVKELLEYNELTLSEISDSLNYSSVAHLSNQFKKITGITPTEFKKAKGRNRKPLDKV